MRYLFFFSKVTVLSRRWSKEFCSWVVVIALIRHHERAQDIIALLRDFQFSKCSNCLLNRSLKCARLFCKVSSQLERNLQKVCCIFWSAILLFNTVNMSISIDISYCDNTDFGFPASACIVIWNITELRVSAMRMHSYSIMMHILRLLCYQWIQIDLHIDLAHHWTSVRNLK